MRKTFKIDTDNDTEKEIDFEALKPGDVFKLVEPDGDIVTNEDGCYLWLAKNEPTLRKNHDEVFQIDCDAFILN